MIMSQRLSEFSSVKLKFQTYFSNGLDWVDRIFRIIPILTLKKYNLIDYLKL